MLKKSKLGWSTLQFKFVFSIKKSFSNDCWKSNHCDQSQQVQTVRLTNSWFSLTWWDRIKFPKDFFHHCSVHQHGSLAAVTSHEDREPEFLAIPCNWLKGRKKSRVEGAISFGFASHWFNNWPRFKPITCVTAFDSSSCHIPTWHRS